MPIWSRCRTSAKKSGGWSSIERLILCMICLLWAVKRHSPRLAGKHRQIPSFTMSMSDTHALSRGETRRGRPGKSRRMHNGWLGVPAFAKAPARQPSCDGLAKTKLQSSEGWWSQTGSNRRPQACKASALPTELWPRLAGLPSRSSRQPARLRPLGSGAAAPSRFASEGWWAWEELNFRPHAYQARALTN